MSRSNSSQFSAKTACLNRIRGLFRLPAAERALCRVTSGRKFGSLFSKIAPNHYQYPKPSFRNVERHGIRFCLDVADLVDWAVYFDFREESLERLYELARPGSVVFDVGANIGNTMLRMAKNVGPTGQVFAFEPDPVTFESCQRNLALNSIGNVTLERLALGSEGSVLHLQRISARNPGMNRLSGEPMETSVKVKVVRLDDYVREMKVSRLDLIKIDVEGYEKQVLLGAADTLKRFQPTLFLEFSDSHLRASGDTPHQLLEILKYHGYSVFHSEDGREVIPGENFAGCHFDIICRPR